MIQKTISEEALRNTILRIAARHMWMAIPKELEDFLVAYIASILEAEFINEKPEGILCGILTELTWAYHVGWLNLEDSDPYVQMKEHCELPSFEAIGPHGTWVRITDCEDCSPFYDADEESMNRMLQECQRYGHYYLR